MVLVYMYTASRQWPCLRAVISHQQCFKQLKIGFQSAHNQEKRKVSKSTYYFTRHSCLQPCRQNNLFAADGRLNNSPNAQSLKKKKKKNLSRIRYPVCSLCRRITIQTVFIKKKIIKKSFSKRFFCFQVRFETTLFPWHVCAELDRQDIIIIISGKGTQQQKSWNDQQKKINKCQRIISELLGRAGERVLRAVSFS